MDRGQVTDQSRDPNEPITPMVEMAANLREIFEALTKTGFSEKQACMIIGQMLAGQG